jgi:hypothetical protein
MRKNHSWNGFTGHIQDHIIHAFLISSQGENPFQNIHQETIIEVGEIEPKPTSY